MNQVPAQLNDAKMKNKNEYQLPSNHNKSLKKKKVDEKEKNNAQSSTKAASYWSYNSKWQTYIIDWYFITINTQDKNNYNIKKLNQQQVQTAIIQRRLNSFSACNAS